MKSKIIGTVAFLLLLVGGASASPESLSMLQSSQSDDVQETIAELENRIAGLEARVSSLESAASQESSATIAPEAETTHVLKGSVSFVLITNDSIQEGIACSGRDAVSTSTDYSGFREGTSITIYDGNNTVLATGGLQAGTTVHETTKLETGREVTFTRCVFMFEVTDLPDSDFYEISIAPLEGRGTYSREDLEERDWTITLRG